MNELDRYLVEINRVRKTVQVYIELFTSKESVDVLTNFSGDVFGCIQRSMHDEIVISLSRLFDGKGYKTKEGMHEYLSQRNLVLKYEGLLTERLINLRNETSQLWNHIDISLYRNLKIAHNDKAVIVSDQSIVRHNISTDKIVTLIDKSTELILGIKLEISESQRVSIPISLDEKFEGKGIDLIQRLK
ncbi:hypothetical protein C9J22_20440 [Photobacterium phosphoreum]|nr:hypothetical protein C9J22_20440 [Photobacterium phosphoreum]